jgi:hypothetical protein
VVGQGQGRARKITISVVDTMGARRRIVIGMLRRACTTFGVALVISALVATFASSTAIATGGVRYPDAAGQMVPFGDATDFGSPIAAHLKAPVTGMAATPTGHGYWLVASDGRVFAYGTARFFGSAANLHLSAPIVGMAATPTGHGYWLVASDGGVFAYGAARFLGSAAKLHLSAQVVGMAVTPTGAGYWLVTSEGGVFTYGRAWFYGSATKLHLTSSVVGMAATLTGRGYWLVTSDGGVFTYGKAGFFGSAAKLHLSSVVGMVAAPRRGGYWLVDSNGGVYSYGRAGFYGSMATQSLEDPIVAMAATPNGAGYWLLPGTAEPTLGPGSSGSAVLSLQQRLSSLGYWLGTPDGSFGDSTEQAVYALQKAAGLTRNGIVGPATYAALDRGVVPQPRSSSGYVVEVDLEDDLLMIVTNGKLDYVLNTSTGGGYTYTATGATAVAETPTGHFQIYREVDGWVVDSLGALWRPKYFDEGFAIHGDTNVPAVPVSHGCVRVSFEAIDWIWTNNILPMGTAVWVY